MKSSTTEHNAKKTADIAVFYFLMLRMKILSMFFRCDTFIFLKNLCEMAAFPKTAFHTDFGDRKLGCIKHKGSLLNAVKINVVDGGVVGE